MDVYELLDTLQSEIENASQVPLINKIMLEKDRILDLLEDLRNAIPKEIAEAKQIAMQQQKIKEDTHKKAEAILEKAKERQKQLINTNTITQNAYEEAEQILKNARTESNVFRAKSIDYTYALLEQTQNSLKELIRTIEQNKAELKESRKNIPVSKQKQQED